MEKTPASPKSPIVWGEEIGKVIGRNRRQTYRLIENNRLPVKRKGRLLVATRDELLAALSAGLPPERDSHEPEQEERDL
jgi:hypothetical protein